MPTEFCGKRTCQVTTLLESAQVYESNQLAASDDSALSLGLTGAYLSNERESKRELASERESARAKSLRVQASASELKAQSS